LPLIIPSLALTASTSWPTAHRRPRLDAIAGVIHIILKRP
jgi:hypothetical protein